MKSEVFMKIDKVLLTSPANATGDTTGLSSIGLLEAVPFIVPSIQLRLGVFAYLQAQAPDIVVCVSTLSGCSFRGLVRQNIFYSNLILIQMERRGISFVESSSLFVTNEHDLPFKGALMILLLYFCIRNSEIERPVRHISRYKRIDSCATDLYVLSKRGPVPCSTCLTRYLIIYLQVLIDYPGVNIPFGRNVKKKFGKLLQHSILVRG